MINKIQNMPNFTGHLAIKTREGKDIDAFVEVIPGEEERRYFKQELDTFQRNIEDETSDESGFVLTMGYDEWKAGDILPKGHGITFDIVDTGREHNASVKNIHSITDENGALRKHGTAFQSDIRKFFVNLKNAVVRKRNLYEVRERDSKRKYRY